MKKHAAIIIAILLLLVGIFIIGRQQDDKTNQPAQKPAPKSQPPTANKKEEFNKKQFSLTESDSVWVVVNKHYQLNPKDYVPEPLVVPKVPLRANITSSENLMRVNAASALAVMVDAAKTEGVQLNLQSGYRSYGFQVSLYNGYVRQMGQAEADTQSARPGYSEHQTGLAVDLGSVGTPSCDIEECFGTTKEGKWLAANAYKYGFIIRYPQGKQAITGYKYEPWHVRYVGSTLSIEMHKQNIQTLEEFFGLGPAPSYN